MPVPCFTEYRKYGKIVFKLKDFSKNFKYTCVKFQNELLGPRLRFIFGQISNFNLSNKILTCKRQAQMTRWVLFFVNFCWDILEILRFSRWKLTEVFFGEFWWKEVVIYYIFEKNSVFWGFCSEKIPILKIWEFSRNFFIIQYG